MKSRERVVRRTQCLQMVYLARREREMRYARKGKFTLRQLSKFFFYPVERDKSIEREESVPKMSPKSWRYRREAGNRVRFAPYNAIINHLPTMILFAASGPGVTYRDAPRTLGRRYITAICNIAFASTRRRKGTEERCPGPTWRAIDRSL